jgi:hypothetical protein
MWRIVFSFAEMPRGISRVLSTRTDRIHAHRGSHNAIHLFRQIVGDQEDDSVDPDTFCDVMQRCHLDRPAHLNQVGKLRAFAVVESNALQF